MSIASVKKYDFDTVVSELVTEAVRTGNFRLVRYLPNGEVRGIWYDDFDVRLVFGVIPHRASRIEVIEDGEHKGQFQVDFCPLAKMTGREEYRQTFSPFSTYEEARRFEMMWLLRHWVLARQ